MEIETKLLRFTGNGDYTGVKLVDEVLSGHLIEVLDSSLWAEIFSSKACEQIGEKSLSDILHECVERFTSNSLSENKQLEVLCFGIANLMSFIQSNWTGPFANFKTLDRLSQWSELSVEQCESLVTQSLILDGEGLCIVAENIELLLIASAIFKSNLPSLKSCKWWLMRCLVIHQQILDEPSQKIYEEIKDIVNTLKEVYKSEQKSEELDDTNEKDLSVLLHLEIAHAFLNYSQVSRSEKEMKAAFDLMNMEVNFVGALGKRTFFQQKELPQLTIDLKVKEKEASNTDEYVIGKCDKDLPHNIPLNDEVSIDGIHFSDPSSAKFPQLSAVEQAALLALFVHLQKSRPKDELQNEELSPYLTCILSQPKFWSFQTSALRLRSLLEKESSRRVDRSLKQLEGLVENIRAEEPPVHHRLQQVFCSYLPPRWAIEADIANILISLGAISSALDVFLRLKMWEQVVTCYNYLKLRHKAAEVIRQEMEKKETVKLWCLLGDATDDVNCYEKAWQMSGEKSAQAQRHWAHYYFERRKYAESIPHFEASLANNSIQLQLWFRLGYAALEEKQWSLCAKAYRRYCSLEPDTFEAWNNLAKAYVKLGQKARAFQALKDAVRCNFENWMVWDNLMAVSTDCGEFEQVIICYHRILDLKKKQHNDCEVLRILVDAIQKNIPDCNGVSAKRLQGKAENLFKRLSENQDNPEIFKLYARLLSSSDCNRKNGENVNIDETSVLDCLKNALRVQLQTRWISSPETCIAVINLAQELTDACLSDSHKDNLPLSKKKDNLSSTKFSLKGVISRIKREHSDPATGEIVESLAEQTNNLQNRITEIDQRLSELNKS
ncbi:hypothetical protein LSTR_LSTR000158 [Laodelphax striatellus]|uniref:Uncharacterized protein n=1 Tax=Laodelphax striatellus TaxID=195883 RepID=A0A482X6P4_LAOST|nr:hypothetical protein LSTR_LSTR000158 [Laodelphax striatellus]